MSERLLATIDQALDDAADADDVLRATVDALAAEPGVAWAGIAFLDEGELALGPSAGRPDESTRTVTPVIWQGAPVGELRVDGMADEALLERIAGLIAAHVLIGWDTGGETWEP